MGIFVIFIITIIIAIIVTIISITIVSCVNWALFPASGEGIQTQTAECMVVAEILANQLVPRAALLFKGLGPFGL